jgi:hypothetical protein
MEDDLIAVRRDVAERMLLASPDMSVDDAVDVYLTTRAEAYERLNRLIAIVQEEPPSLDLLTVALRQVRSVVT